MKTPTLLALTLTTALLSACGGTPTPAPATQLPSTLNPPFAFTTHDLTIHAGESIKLTANIPMQSSNIIFEGTVTSPAGLGLTARNITQSSTTDINSFLLVAAQNAPTYDTYLYGGGLKDAANPYGYSTFDWMKVHVVGSSPAPWLHPEMLTGTAGPIETEFVRLLNQARATGGTCTDTTTGKSATYPPAAPVTLNEQASGGLRVKAKDAVTRHWYTHESPEGLGSYDYILQAGMTGFVNEALRTGGYDPTVTATYEATVILNGFLHSYYHCGFMYASSPLSGGQVAVGWYAGTDPQMPGTNGLLMSVMPVSFTADPAPGQEPVLKLN